MTRDEIIRMAREAGIYKELVWDDVCHERVERFATLVAAAEREACAKVCEEFGKTPANMSQAWRNGCLESATEIRARGQE